jgi:trans-aconitate methyltransferase
MSANAWNASLYDEKHSFVFEYGRDIVSLLAPQPGEHILDLGCGTGHLTRQIADAGASVVGIDASSAMIETAQRSNPEVEFMVADATQFAFTEPFDAVFSNAVLHWIPDAGAVAERIARALKTGGRFVAEFGGKDNIKAIVAAAHEVIWERLQVDSHHGWYYPSIGAYAAVLEQHGLEVRSAALFDRLTRLDGEHGMHNWLAMFGANMLREVPPTRKADIVEALVERLRPNLCRDGVWYADYRRLRIVAVKLVST